MYHQTLGQWDDWPSDPVYHVYWRLSDFYRFSYYRCNVLTTVDLRPSSNVIGNEEGPFLWFMILAFEGQFLQLLLVHLKSEDYFLTLYLYEEVSNVKKSQKFSLSAKPVYQDFAACSWTGELYFGLILPKYSFWFFGQFSLGFFKVLGDSVNYHKMLGHVCFHSLWVHKD